MKVHSTRLAQVQLCTLALAESVQQLQHFNKHSAVQISAWYGVMQAAESKHAAAVESLKEGWVHELKQQKEAWAAAEKARRDTWLADKTKQVKELTVKVRPTSATCLVRHCWCVSATTQQHLYQTLFSEGRLCRHRNACACQKSFLCDLLGMLFAHTHT